MQPSKDAFDLNWQPVTETGCWIWDGPSKIQRGEERGRIMMGGVRMFAHRWSWTIHRGEIPADKQINHHCDQTLCVNPDHLYLGTQADNVRDRDARCRRSAPKGEMNSNAKLTEMQVREIRSMPASNADIARMYGVSSVLIGLIRRGKAWRHVNG